MYHLLSRSIYASAKIAANLSGQHFKIKGICNCFGHIFFPTSFCSESTSPWKIKVTFCNKWSQYDISRQAKDKLYNCTIKMLLIKAKKNTHTAPLFPYGWKELLSIKLTFQIFSQSFLRSQNQQQNTNLFLLTHNLLSHSTLFYWRFQGFLREEAFSLSSSYPADKQDFQDEKKVENTSFHS